MLLEHKRIGVLVDEGFEDLEFWVPVMRLREEGAQVLIIATKMETFHGKHCLAARPDVLIDQVDPNSLDALVVPGGWAPDKLRRSEAVLALVRAMDAQHKIIAAICHAGWVLASAGIVRGKRATGSRGIRDDLINAGAIWVDEPALRDGNLVWGRVVEDIPAFCRELVHALAEN